MLKILIVDDEQQITEALKDFFSKKNYTVLVANNGEAALDIVKKQRPHLVFLDICMPRIDGLTVLRNIRDWDKSIKVIMVTALGTKEIIAEAARFGAVDFIRKPFTLEYLEQEVIAKVNAQLFEDLRGEIEEKNQLIEQLKKLNERILRSFYQTMLSLAAALEARDRYTHGHSERVASYSRLIAEELKRTNSDEINNEFLDALNIESHLHDIGKIAVPDMVLNKPGRLTDEEYDEIKRHPIEGVRILVPLDGIKDNIEVIYSHHERIDGKGYPDNKVRDNIPLRARIIAVADSFDAMTTDRPYRKAMSVDNALSELERNKDTQFDSIIVDAFSKAYRKVKKWEEKVEMKI